MDAARSWSQLRTSIRHARETPGLLRFLVGRFFYTDPVNTAIVVMSAFAVQAVGFTSGEALNILLLLAIGGVAVDISRTGYTGDLGYEIWMAADEAVLVWDALMTGGGLDVVIETLAQERVRAREAVAHGRAGFTRAARDVLG